MKTFNAIAAAAILGLSSTLFAGASVRTVSAYASVSNDRIESHSAESLKTSWPQTPDPFTSSRSAIERVDQSQIVLTGATATSVRLEPATYPRPLVRRFDPAVPKWGTAPTAVPLPPAAPAAIVTLGLIAAVAYVRRMLTKSAAPY